VTVADELCKKTLFLLLTTVTVTDYSCYYQSVQNTHCHCVQ